MKIFTLFFLPLLLSCAVSAQTACYESIDSESIISLTDDQDYIWCGTEENGLLRINKTNQEKTYWNMSNGDMKSNRIKSLCIYNDKLYVSSDSTLLLWQDETISRVHEDVEGLLMENEDGDLLIVGRRDFYMMDSDETLMYHKDLTEVVADQCCSQNTDIAIDASANLWISHWDFYEFDIMKFDGSEWSVYDISNTDLPIESPGPNKITASGNTVYASNYLGVYQFEAGEWTNITASIANEEEQVTGLITMTIENDSEDLLWVAADGINFEKTKKIGFSIDGEWSFIDSEGNDFPRLNLFQESLNDTDLVYAGTQEGLVVIDRSCLLPIISIEESVLENEFAVYPIPSTKILHIESDATIDRVELFDMKGNLVLQQDNNTGNINVDHLDANIYLMKLYQSDRVFVRRIVKK